MPNDIIVYHSPCRDGFTAAWAFWTKYGHYFEYLGEHVKSYPITRRLIKDPNINERNIIFVDICPTRELLVALHNKAKSVYVLDHHDTADRECGDLPYVHIDKSHSGCGIAWNYLYPDYEPPYLVRAVEDGDLYKWEVPDSKPVLTWLSLQRYTFENWNKFRQLLDNPDKREKITSIGRAYLTYQDHLIHRRIVTRRKIHWLYLTNIDGEEIKVAAVNNGLFASDVGHQLGKRALAGAIYYTTGTKWIFSLRSNERGADCEKIARHYGGGGHFHASAFSIKDINELRSEELTEEEANLYFPDLKEEW